jgi:hypothetical protein
VPFPNDPNHAFYNRRRSPSSQNLGSVANRRNGLSLPEILAKSSISVLDLSVRSRNALLANGTKTVGELALLSDGKLLKLQNFGHKSLIDVHRALDQFLAKHAAEYSNAASSNALDSAQLPRTDVPMRSSGGWMVPGGRGDKAETVDDRLKAPVEVLDLSTRPSNVLNRLHIADIGQLLVYPKHRMISAENMGAKSLKEIESKVFAYLSGKQVEDGNECSSVAAPPSPSLGTRAFIDQVLQLLAERQRNIIKDRYGLWDGIAETLQDIGDKLGLTRERIRQIEAKGLKRLRRVYGFGAIKTFVVTKIAAYLAHQAETTRGIVSEDEITNAFTDDCSTEEAALAVGFLRDVNASLFASQMVEAESGVYTPGKGLATEYKTLLQLIERVLERCQKPVSEQSFYQSLPIDSGGTFSEEQIHLVQRILAVSPTVVRLHNGTIALSKWTEFQRRDVASVAAAALRLLGRPAHFRELTQKIGTLFPDLGDINERSLHNALVCDREQFVWVKSGTYGLKAWGLARPPYIKDRLIELLSESSYPLPYWHLRKRVLEVCNCKETSVRMTLDLNPTVFKKFEGDQYGLRKHFEDGR